MDYDQHELRKYLESHTAITIAEVERLCSIPKDTLRHFVKERRELSLQHFEKISDLLSSQYGFIPLGGI